MAHRQIYHLRGRYDAPVLSVAEAIALGERLMRRRRSQIVPAGFGRVAAVETGSC